METMRRFNKESNALAKQLAEEAITLDPNYAPAYRALSGAHQMDVWLGVSKSPKQSITKAIELLQKAITLDDTYAEAYSALGFVFSMTEQHDKAVAKAEHGVALNPNSADAHMHLGHTLRFAGRYEESIPEYKIAIRLNPFPPNNYLFGLGQSYAYTGQYEGAITWGKKAVRQNPNDFIANVLLTEILSLAGRDEEARIQAAEVLRISPKFTLEKWRKRARGPNKETHIDALRKAGLPESPPLPLPDKPSIAVLPFENMSDDPKQEYFSDGLTEEIITALSKVRRLFVIARNSTYTYKGKPVKVQHVSRDLGVRYVLEGSVRKSGDQVRITAQLIDATTGNHLWAERYDRELKNIFAVQDEITKNIIMAMQVKLTDGEQARAVAKGTKNLEAYLKYLQARDYVLKLNPESNALGKELAEEAITLDPEYAMAYRLVGAAHMNDLFLGTSKSPKDSITKAIELTKKAIALDDTYAEAHGSLGFLYSITGQYDKAIAESEKAVTLNPNSARSHYMVGKTLSFAGMWEKSIPAYKKAIRLNPIPPNMYLWSLGLSYCYIGQYEEAITWGEKAIRQEPDSLLANRCMAAIYSMSGRKEEARVQAAEVLRIQPKFSLKKFEKKIKFKEKTDRERYISALRKAGLK
jgi:TolB-like protein/Tfp pilus assembly protein PilF